MSTEKRILTAAAALLESDGPKAITTRAVCAAAEITAPTLYHHFGDRDGLLDALLTQGIAEFMAGKRAARKCADPTVGLRRGWDVMVDFALRRPALLKLMVERASEDPELAREARSAMRANLERMSLTVSVDLAARSMEAASMGLVALIAQGAAPAEINELSSFLFDSILARLRTGQ
jgi:AcrR family transcriptional regulator